MCVSLSKVPSPSENKNMTESTTATNYSDYNSASSSKQTTSVFWSTFIQDFGCINNTKVSKKKYKNLYIVFHVVHSQPQIAIY